ncbi:hypothetical protein DT076_12425 [Desertihabitans brevis]|uniref:Uncharacterized protein n=1 Tax=Desertihabitans brevis TaxID=2268447 RepID=A0A367YTG9_9ACTN|nr:DUF6270 domain-containing protein [Desertihabitans brevis]RCK69144.1 hypothetical protein DT076_12425 [Desertihabitans brevis]
MSTTNLRVFVYGGCVSRDTFTHLDGENELLGYVARQSLMSIDRPAEGVREKLHMPTSAFQQRMIEGDIAGNALERIEAVGDAIDVLVFDVLAERVGVLEAGHGVVTKLPELMQAGGAEATRGARFVRFGSDEHHAQWSVAARRFRDRLHARGLLEKSLLLKTPWATELAEGGEVPVPSWMTHPHEANRAYARYFDRLRELGFSVLDLPDHLTRSTASHRWGPSPFHYFDDAYRYFAAQVAAFGRRAPQLRTAAAPDPSGPSTGAGVATSSAAETLTLVVTATVSTSAVTASVSVGDFTHFAARLFRSGSQVGEAPYTRSRTITFDALPPGRYRVRVFGRKDGGPPTATTTAWVTVD